MKNLGHSCNIDNNMSYFLHDYTLNKGRNETNLLIITVVVRNHIASELVYINIYTQRPFDMIKW